MSSTPHPLMVVPAPHQLRAHAVWVTIANWAAGMRGRYGGVTVLGPDGALDPASVAATPPPQAAGAGAGASPPRAGRVIAETAAKDLRWWARDLRRRRQRLRHPHAPFVWQHHDLFQRHGARLARRSGLPLVQFVDAPYVWESSRWGVRRPGWRRLVAWAGDARPLRDADLVCVVSHEVGEAVRALGVADDRVLVTPCTAEIDTYAGAGDHRAALGLEGRFVLGWVGSFRRFHDLDLLIEAAARVPASARLSLLLVGAGSEHAAICAAAAAAGVHLVAPGGVGHDEVPAYLRTMDAAALPCRQSTFHYSPLKLKEFMAAGLPVLAPAVGEMARTLEDGVDASLYRPADVADLARRITALADEPELRGRLGDGARRTAAARYSIASQLAEVERRLA